MNNVRCAGSGSWRAIDESEGYGIGVPCGWTGERSHGQIRAVGDRENPRYVTTVATLKPCPRCGGRVALIERTTP